MYGLCVCTNDVLDLNEIDGTNADEILGSSICEKNEIDVTDSNRIDEKALRDFIGGVWRRPASVHP